MTYGRQPQIDKDIDWVIDEDNNILGYMRDQRSMARVVTVDSDTGLITDPAQRAAVGEAAVVEAAVFVQSGTGAVARTAQEKLRDSVSVRDFGAVGDGVADDTVAIQAALNSGAKTVHFPAGTYNVSSPVMINSYTMVYGDGMATTVIKTNNTTVTLTDPTSGLSYTKNCVFYANPSHVTNPWGADAAVQITVERMHITSSAAFSVGSSAFYTTQLGRAKFSEIRVIDLDWAIDAQTLYLTRIDRALGRGCQINTGTSLDISASGGGGTTGSPNVWKLNNVVYSTMTGCVGEERTTAFRLDNCNMSLVSCGMELCTSTGTKASFIDFGDNNNITVIDPVVYVPSSAATGPIFSSSGGNNRIRIVGGKLDHNTGQDGVYDLWIQAYGSDIWFEDTIFYAGTTSGLNVKCNGAMNRNGSPAFVRSGGNITKFTPNSTSSPLLQSGFDLLNTATSNEIQTNFTTGGGAFDNFVVKYAANGSDDLRLIKRGSSSSGSFGSTAGGADLILVGGSGDLAIGTSSTATGGVRIGSSGTARLNVIYHTYPGGDNLYTLGTGSNRWQVVYAATGTITTSDERTKQDVASLDDIEKRVASTVKGLVKKFRFKDAVQAKGDAARIHFGVIAQEVMVAFQAEGLDPMRYGIICYDQWPDEFEDVMEDVTVVDENGEQRTEQQPTGEKRLVRAAGNRYGVRYEELLAFIISAF